jgi:hypothetical protein
MSTIFVRVTRPLHFRGQVFAAGATIKAAPLDAAGLVGTGRAELEHADDVVALREAVEADTKRVISQAGRPWHGPQTAAPWQRVL